MRFYIKYFFYWLLYFALARLVFLVFHYDKLDTNKHSLQEVALSFVHGMRMDASMAAYLSIVPFILYPFISKRFIGKCLNAYHYVVLALTSLMVVADLSSYKAWGFRLDASILDYMSHPKEALASTLTAPLGWLALIFVVLASAFGYLYARWVEEKTVAKIRAVLLLALPLLVLPMRGGWGVAPLNPGSVFFSAHPFLNVLALNACWNFMHTAAHKKMKKNPFVVCSEKELKVTMDSLTAKTNPAFYLHQKQKPNVIIVIWESLTAKMYNKQHKGVSVIPTIDSLSQNAVWFSRMYASGDRTEKGLAAILSAYPAQALTSIVKETKKASSLPSPVTALAQRGYETSFIYGGDLEFAGMGAYLRSMGFGQIKEMDDFPKEQHNSKWGAHDEFIFQKSIKTLQERPAQKPFFHAVLTLTSHEPFETPRPKKITGNDELSLFYNAHRYTDDCLKAYMHDLKKAGLWDNTILIILGDHGHRLPTAQSKIEDFAIPMIWTGGAIDTTFNQTKATSQTDLMPTLLAQLGLDARAFTFGKNALSAQGAEWAFFAFNNGIGYVNKDNAVVFDNAGKRVIEQRGKNSGPTVEVARRVQQAVVVDYLGR
ncbi:MAG: sulfatase-like hydrolase/transferase [Saprospiraceae bacterium]|nr:sulfatase-like hydrolase/transferase [Saprospiraceae bacterium]